MKKGIKLVVVNGKGGASKSTTSLQVASAYFLDKNLPVKLIELDDENKDSEHFTNSKIVTEQQIVDMGETLSNDLISIMANDENLVFDVGGNKTTTLFLNALKSSRMYRKVDLFIIPMSGGSQDVKNAFRTYETIKEIDENAKVIFALSRVRNLKRINWQYQDFFTNENSKNHDFIALQDSDVIDLSRSQKQSVYELATNRDYKKGLEKEFDKALDKNDNNTVSFLAVTLQIFDECEEYLEKTLKPAFQTIEKNITGDKGE